MSLDVLKQQQDPSRDRFSSSFTTEDMLRAPKSEIGGMEGGEESVRRLVDGKGTTFDIPAGQEFDFMFWVGTFNALSNETNFVRDPKKKAALEQATLAALDIRNKLKGGADATIDVQPAKMLIEKAFATVQ